MVLIVDWYMYLMVLIVDWYRYLMVLVDVVELYYIHLVTYEH